MILWAKTNLKQSYLQLDIGLSKRSFSLTIIVSFMYSTGKNCSNNHCSFNSGAYDRLTNLALVFWWCSLQYHTLEKPQLILNTLLLSIMPRRTMFSGNGSLSSSTSILLKWSNSTLSTATSKFWTSSRISCPLLLTTDSSRVGKDPIQYNVYTRTKNNRRWRLDEDWRLKMMTRWRTA